MEKLEKLEELEEEVERPLRARALWAALLTSAGRRATATGRERQCGAQVTTRKAAAARNLFQTFSAAARPASVFIVANSPPAGPLESRPPARPPGRADIDARAHFRLAGGLSLSPLDSRGEASVRALFLARMLKNFQRPARVLARTCCRESRHSGGLGPSFGPKLRRASVVFVPPRDSSLLADERPLGRRRAANFPRASERARTKLSCWLMEASCRVEKLTC